MSVAIVIPENWEPSKLILWSTAIARARNEDLLIVRTKRQTSRRNRKKTNLAFHTDGSPLAVAIREHAGNFSVIDLEVKEYDKDAARETLILQHKPFI